MRLSKSDDILT